MAHHEPVDRRRTVEHLFDVGGAGALIVDSIAQMVEGPPEILHGLIDVFFLSASIDRVTT